MQMNVERFVGKGEAKDVICNAVEKLRADTLVMGSHGYGFMKRYIHLNFVFSTYPFLRSAFVHR